MSEDHTGVVLTHAQQVAIGRRMQKIARMVDRELEKAAGQPVPFSLFTWGGGRSQYVSNTRRDQAMLVMDETLARWRAGEEELGKPQDAH